MKINFPILEEALDINGVNILVSKPTQIFADLVKWIYQYGDEEVVLTVFDDKYTKVQKSEIMSVIDVLGFEINSTAVLKLIHEDLTATLNEKPAIKSRIEHLALEITEILGAECLESELDLEYDEITILELIKALGVKIETRSDSIFEKCLEIIQVFKFLKKKKLLIFINVIAYLARTEVLNIIEYAELHNIRLLFIEPNNMYDLPCYEIDHDYFVIRKN